MTLSGETNTTWSKNEPIIITPTKNYSAFDAVELAKDMGFTKLASVIPAIENNSVLSIDGFAAPGVDTFISYGGLFGLSFLRPSSIADVVE